jgi:hypothetical protein
LNIVGDFLVLNRTFDWSSKSLSADSTVSGAKSGSRFDFT